jgi:hypothetical protein
MIEKLTVAGAEGVKPLAHDRTLAGVTATGNRMAAARPKAGSAPGKTFALHAGHRGLWSHQRAGASLQPAIFILVAQRFTIDAKVSGSRLAPPTRSPSISGCAIRLFALSGLTLPPYRIRTLFAASAPKLAVT